jgi:hypothetical protein
MGEEVAVQGDMLRNLETDLGKAQEHVEKVNEKLKETLAAVSGRFEGVSECFVV